MEPYKVMKKKKNRPFQSRRVQATMSFAKNPANVRPPGDTSCEGLERAPVERSTISPEGTSRTDESKREGRARKGIYTIQEPESRRPQWKTSVVKVFQSQFPSQMEEEPRRKKRTKMKRTSHCSSDEGTMTGDYRKRIVLDDGTQCISDAETVKEVRDRRLQFPRVYDIDKSEVDYEITSKPSLLTPLQSSRKPPSKVDEESVDTQESLHIIENLDVKLDRKVREYMDGENLVELRILKYFAESEMVVGRKQINEIERECSQFSINECVHVDVYESQIFDPCAESDSMIYNVGCAKDEPQIPEICINLFWRKRIRKFWILLIELPFYLFFMTTLGLGIKAQREVSKQLLCSYTEQVLTSIEFTRPKTDIKITLNDVESTEEIWKYMKTVIKPVLIDEPESFTARTNTSLVFLNQKVIGLPWFHQIKYHPALCNCFDSNYNKYFRSCIPVQPTRIVRKVFSQVTYEKYQKQKYLPHLYRGKFWNYPSEGYSFLLPSQIDQAADTFDEVQDFWIDTLTTRIFFLDFVTYNAGTRTFYFIKLVFEHPAAGGWHHKIIVYPFNESNVSSIFLRGHALTFCLAVALYITYCVIRIYKNFEHLKSFWMIYNIVLLAFSVLFILYGIILNFILKHYATRMLNGMITLMNDRPITQWVDAYYFYYKQQQFEAVLSALYVFASLKMLHFLGIFYSFYVIGVSIRKHLTDFIIIIIMLFLTLHLYALGGLLYYRLESKSYSTYTTALTSSIQMLFGVYNYNLVMGKFSTRGAFYIIIFTIFIKFFYEATFIAMVVNYFCDSLAGLGRCDGVPTVKMLLAEFFYSGLKILGFKTYAKNKQACLNSNFFLLVNALKRSGRSEDEINNFLNNHRVSAATPLPLHTMESLYRHILKFPHKLDETAFQETMSERIRMLRYRMAYIGDNLCFILQRLKELQPFSYKQLRRYVAVYMTPTKKKASIWYILAKINTRKLKQKYVTKKEEEKPCYDTSSTNSYSL